MGNSAQASIAIQHPLRGFYETAGVVKVFFFAFAFSLLAFLLLLLRLFLVRALDSSRASIRTRLSPGYPLGRGSVPDGAR